jgi:hypothetical protein
MRSIVSCVNNQNDFSSAVPVTFIAIASLAIGIFGIIGTSRCAEPTTPTPFLRFEGEKVDWHGFDRYDFLMDEQSLTFTQFKAPAGEKSGVKDPEHGQRRCIVVVPKVAAPGHPWSWRGCYWDHQPQTEIELLKRGFHVAYISANATLKPGKEWDAWYEYLTERRGLSRKPAFVGMSRGGEYAYTWATAHPDKVACIYADNPGMNREAFAKLGDLARCNVPLLHVCGSLDPILGKNSTAIENIYQQFGGRISVMIKEGFGHHPHSLRDPSPIANFIVQSTQETSNPPPAFVGERFTKSAYYSVENLYRDYPSEGTYIACRGPLLRAAMIGSISIFQMWKEPSPSSCQRTRLKGRSGFSGQALLTEARLLIWPYWPRDFTL